MKWKIPGPKYATIEEWEEWKEWAKKAHPIRFFFQENVRGWFRVKAMTLRDIKWWFIHRLVPKHRYHVIKPKTLTPNYYDPRTLILHSCMHLLTDYVDNSNHIHWEGTPEHKKAREEMMLIYNWWKKSYPKRESTFINGSPLPKYPDLPKEWGFMAVINSKYENEPVMKEWKKIARIHDKSEQEWNKQTEEMLIRLMKLRQHLWY